ncbi:unnamed protein product [Prorocentrum cordatum]|uniref:Uncharacterized protein n=1 Tax=Prorocentrum cordatum TaxID=2364126 RepID=A0ABN9XTK0_9DINO|nr:unnamed protein product [Polarella glacialis]
MASFLRAFVCVAAAEAVWLDDRRAISDAVGWPHGENIAELAKLVTEAALRKRPELLPDGYRLLDDLFPFPNAQSRQRTRIMAGMLQVFGIVLFRYHNTAAWWDAMGASFLTWCAAAPLQEKPGALRDDPDPTGFFSWFVREAPGCLVGFGLGYWLKFVFGDLSLVSPGAVDLAAFAIVGRGAIAALRTWGYEAAPKQTSAHPGGQQLYWLNITREVCRLLAAALAASAAASLARQAGLADLSVYDVQVMLCMLHRQGGLAARRRAQPQSARAPESAATPAAVSPAVAEGLPSRPATKRLRRALRAAAAPDRGAAPPRATPALESPAAPAASAPASARAGAAAAAAASSFSRPLRRLRSAGSAEVPPAPGAAAVAAAAASAAQPAVPEASQAAAASAALPARAREQLSRLRRRRERVLDAMCKEEQRLIYIIGGESEEPGAPGGRECAVAEGPAEQGGVNDGRWSGNGPGSDPSSWWSDDGNGSDPSSSERDSGSEFLEAIAAEHALWQRPEQKGCAARPSRQEARAKRAQLQEERAAARQAHLEHIAKQEQGPAGVLSDEAPDEGEAAPAYGAGDLAAAAALIAREPDRPRARVRAPAGPQGPPAPHAAAPAVPGDTALVPERRPGTDGD